jgi:3-hydroxyisobutyrate dehydrogenase
MTQRVAILGIGTMGSGMATNLIKAGFAVNVYNRTRAKAEPLAALGAQIADSPAAAASNADIILTMLADENASRTVWLGEHGALKAAKPEATLVESSTVTPAWIAELSSLAHARSLPFLDAPVTGSRVQAETAQLSILVGGDRVTLEKARPMLAAISKEILHLGPIGSGARLKLINNFLCGVQAASLAEALAWIERSGLNRDQSLNFLKSGAPGSPVFNALAARMIQATYEVNFLLPLMRKDLNYALADAVLFDIPLRTASAAESRFSDAVQAGFDQKDMSAIIEPLRAR